MGSACGDRRRHRARWPAARRRPALRVGAVDAGCRVDETIVPGKRVARFVGVGRRVRSSDRLECWFLSALLERSPRGDVGSGER